MLDLVEKIQSESRAISNIVNEAVGSQVDILNIMTSKHMPVSLISKLADIKNGSASASMCALLEKDFVTRKRDSKTKRKIFLYTINKMGELARERGNKR